MEPVAMADNGAVEVDEEEEKSKRSERFYILRNLKPPQTLNPP